MSVFGPVDNILDSLHGDRGNAVLECVALLLDELSEFFLNRFGWITGRSGPGACFVNHIDLECPSSLCDNSLYESTRDVLGRHGTLSVWAISNT